MEPTPTCFTCARNTWWEEAQKWAAQMLRLAKQLHGGSFGQRAMSQMLKMMLHVSKVRLLVDPRTSHTGRRSNCASVFARYADTAPNTQQAHPGLATEAAPRGCCRQYDP
mmetsp:Transcript_21029/g.36103  ORF Transcript_21029/g.36103 Transcript_21029/m.36103 type:complete len:110 (+) Transcript_21029:277-606(+)